MYNSRLFDFYAQNMGYFSLFMKKEFEWSTFRIAKKVREK